MPRFAQHELRKVVVPNRPGLLACEVLVVLQQDLPLNLQLLQQLLAALAQLRLLRLPCGFDLLQHISHPLHHHLHELGQLVTEATHGHGEVVCKIQGIAQPRNLGIVGEGIEVVADHSAEEAHHGHRLRACFVGTSVDVGQYVFSRRLEGFVHLVPESQHGLRRQGRGRQNLQRQLGHLSTFALATFQREVLRDKAIRLGKLQARRLSLQ
mmetsp:Transcript_94403/g.224850  ORF Transcript_94403/g.224850 Transcript_94403/m.224850 type:complete len:210 (+) Transcript_94403:1030-1659(+)